MPDHALLLQALKSFAVVMGGNYDINEMSFQLALRVTEALDVAGAGVSVADRTGQLKCVSASSRQIVEMEAVQEGAQEGPCIKAFLSQRPVLVDDIAALDRWPDYRAAAGRLGLGAVVGYPLSYDGIWFGALNLYAATPRTWPEEDIDTIKVFADMATAYLIRNSRLAEAEVVMGQLQSALDSRVIIEQAKGVLANEHGITTDRAFAAIRRFSQNNNIQLSEVARSVVDDGLKVPPDACI